MVGPVEHVRGLELAVMDLVEIEAPDDGHSGDWDEEVW